MATQRFIGRSVKFLVMTDPGDPEAEPVVDPTYTEMYHNGISITENVKEADLTTTGDAGRNYSVPAERGTMVSVSAKCLYDATTGDADTAQAFIRTLNDDVDTAGIGSFRLEVLGIHRRDFDAWVKVEDLGADQNEGAPFNVELHVVGTITPSTISA